MIKDLLKNLPFYNLFALPSFFFFFFNDLFASTDSWADDEKYECDVGWQAFQAGCYKLTSEKTDWDSAQKTCQKMEANLVSIHTLPELEFIIRITVLGFNIDQVWIGLHDTDMQMDFQWTDHTPVIFTYWHPFEPNNFRNTQEDCVSIWGAVSDLHSPSHDSTVSRSLYIFTSCAPSFCLCVAFVCRTAAGMTAPVI
uniref:C-type lectin domain-containing protein n=1 Tax=Stegastes partitus TaxID=144197 RepID=A0A3B5AKD1_9TELE